MKNISNGFIILITYVSVSFTSCEKILFEKTGADRSPGVNFEYLWDEIDKKYAYFDLKNIDWDYIKTKYQPRINEQMTDDSLFAVLRDMIFELRDDHTNLRAPFNVAAYRIFLTAPDNFESRIILDHYITDDINVTGGFMHGLIKNENIGYVRYSSFSNAVTDNALNIILNRYSEALGIVLDLRENGGGAVSNIAQILERFVQERTLVAYNVTRNGPGRSDFGPRRSFFLNPTESVFYSKPVMVLIDRGSYSATTFFSLATKALPNITLIGDTTGGGGGLPNGGQLPNGWTYRFSISQTLDLQGNNFAENGVPPDIYAQLDWSDLSKDEILERAIDELKK